MITSKPALFILASTLTLTLLISTSGAQTTTVEDREPLTGQQLFTKEWKFTEHPNRSPAVGDRVDSAESSLPTTSPRAARFRDEFRRNSELKHVEKVGLSLGDGLGPMHNATSCNACHAGGGASGVAQNIVLLTIDPRSEIIKQTKKGAATLREFFPAVLRSDGALRFEVVVHNYSARGGYESLRNRLAEYIPGGVSDGWFLPTKRTVEAIANKPVIAGRFASIDYYLSQRNAPPLFGIGSLHRISNTKRTAIAEKQARESNGVITGRLAGVYGWRGQLSSLPAFVAQACAVELGLTQDTELGMMGVSDGRNKIEQFDDPVDPNYTNQGIDVTSDELRGLTQFVSAIPQPIERANPNLKRSELLAGEKLFDSVGCSSCHVADMHPVKGLFSDLLLHDMGAALQAPSPAIVAPQEKGERMAIPIFEVERPRPSRSVQLGYGDFPVEPPIARNIPQPVEPQFPRGAFNDDGRDTWDSLQREWRTAPLWGIADTGPYLHDGRAATIEDAIRWHGGEAEAVKQRFAELPQVEKEMVLTFLATLRAPDVRAD